MTDLEKEVLRDTCKICGQPLTVCDERANGRIDEREAASMTKPTDAMNITLDGVEQPKRIWLQSYPHAGEVTWCQDQNPEGDDELETVEYVRADTRPQSAAPSPDAYWERPFGDAGDAIDFVCDHGKPENAVAFLEDWRSAPHGDFANIWPEYMRWLKVQHEGAKASATPASPDADLVERLRQARKEANGSYTTVHIFDLSAAIEALTATAPTSDSDVERMRDLLDTERYKVAIGVQAIRKALDGRRWLSEAGRGSYSYDDERYQQEFGEALNEIDAALEPLRRIAGDWSDCPTDPLRVAANRAAATSDSDAPFADALRTLERHYYSDEELAQWLGAPQPLLDGQTPLQLLAAGRKAEIFACVQRLDDGVYL